MAWQRKTPFGYMVQNGKTVPCPPEAEAVRGIFAHYLAGLSYAKIAEEMSGGNIPYHQHTSQWNKHMVKRILGNGRYLGSEIYPQLISDGDFLAAQLQREDKANGTPCPNDIAPIRRKAVCAVCGGRITRDTKSKGRPRWVCRGADCGTISRISDEDLLRLISDRLSLLAQAPSLLTQASASADNSLDALRLQNEINLCLNRSDINADYIKTLIFTAAGEQYAALPDPTPGHDLKTLRERLEARPANEDDLRELFAKAVKAVRIGGQSRIELELINGQINGNEQTI